MISNMPPVVSRSLPLLGHALEFKKNLRSLLQRGFHEHGAVFRLKLAKKNVVVVIGPEHQRKFFEETDKSLNIQKPYQFLRAMFGEVLFLAPHEEYLEQRPIVHEAFKRSKMLHYITVMERVVQQWLDRLGDVGEIELTSEINWLVQEVAGRCFLGDDTHEQLGREFWDLYADLNAGLDPLLPPHLPLPKFRRRDRAHARMAALLHPIITHRRQNPEQYDDFLQDLVAKRYKDGSEVEEELILNMLLGLMFAGHETTAGQAAWTLIMLLQSPEYLQRVQDEIDTLSPLESQLTARQLGQMDHIAWAVREVERVRPSANILMRVAEEDIEFGGYLVPKGSLVQLATNIAHNLPDYFENPEMFDPLRYAPDRQEDKADRYALVGFGGGVHKCTGMNFANTEMTVITALLFQQFDVELITKNPGIESGLGAERPELTKIAYRRKHGSVSHNR